MYLYSSILNIVPYIIFLKQIFWKIAAVHLFVKCIIIHISEIFFLIPEI